MNHRVTLFGATLKFRLALASVVVITLCVALATQLVLSRVHQGVQLAVMDLERANAERMANLLSSRVMSLQQALRSLSEDPSFQATLADPVALRARLGHTHTLRTIFARLFVAMADGRVVALYDHNGTHDPGFSIADRPYFQQTLKAGLPLVSAPITSRVSDTPILQFTMPVRGHDGSVLAVLGGALPLDARNLMTEITRDGRVADDPVTTLVIDTAGHILSHRLAERVMQTAQSEPGLLPALQRWARQGRPVEPTGDVMQADGQIVASAGVPLADWLVMRIAREDTLLGGVLAARRDSLLLCAGVAVAGALLLLGVLGWLLRPLTRLQRRALALGNAELPIDQGWPQADGEIGQLSAVLRRAMRDRAASEHEVAALLRKMQLVMATAPIGIAFSRHERLDLVSAEFAALLGWPEGRLEGRPLHEVLDCGQGTTPLGAHIDDAFSAGRPFTAEMQFRRHDGGTLWGRLQGRPVDAADADAGTIWLLEDVTVQRAERERLAWSASHDTLTRLANRETFEARLTALLAQGGDALPSMLMFIDLDHFKRVNDSAGHAAGDKVLREVAQLLTSQVRGSDLPARLGGDEFAVLMPHCERATALRIAERIRAGVQKLGIEHQGTRLQIGTSIGVVDVAAGFGMADLLARADEACYAAKRAGRDAVQLAPT